MRVLLVHPEDDLPPGNPSGEWGLVVDLGRAPASTYARWSAQMGCAVISVYGFAEGMPALRLCRERLRSGMGFLVDSFGIDWWDVLSLGMIPTVLQFALFERLLNYIGGHCQFYVTRPIALAPALRNNGQVKVLGGGSVALRKKFQHYKRVLRNLDAAQIWQVVQDKFDRHHAIRSRLSRRPSTPHVPVILLPSAYINVSRMAVRLAELLPDQKFLLVYARRNGQLHTLPGNVFTTSLDVYFGRESVEESHIFHKWRVLKHRLIHSDKMFEALECSGILRTVESDLQWLLRIRDAWANVLDREPIAGCLCADDTNPYTRIPLLLTTKRGLPTVACHHGALDCWMSLKTLVADSYLAKSEIERDYLIYSCGLDSNKIILGGPAAGPASKASTQLHEKPWMVFFTEPYESSGWRSEEVHQDLLPRLCSLAQSCGLKLILKLHPFDSVRSYRKKLRRIVGDQGREVQLIAGPPTNDLWKKTKFALTVESSAALECAARGIPVFLCTWLRDAYSGYVQQYIKFGVGCALDTPEHLAGIPQVLKTKTWPRWDEKMNPESLRALALPNIGCDTAPKPQVPATCAASVAS